MKAFLWGIILLCIQADHHTSCLPAQELNYRRLSADVYTCTRKSLRVGFLWPYLLDLHHRLFPLAPILALSLLHSRTCHFIVLPISLSHLPHDWDFSFFLLCSHRFTITWRPHFSLEPCP